MSTKHCKHIYGLHVSGADNKPSKRVTWCCDLRYGFRLNQWRCVGLGHADCPLTAEQSAHPTPESGGTLPTVESNLENTLPTAGG